jgi:hypothetical protein
MRIAEAVVTNVKAFPIKVFTVFIAITRQEQRQL